METKALLSSGNVSMSSSVKTLTSSINSETPDWIKDLCEYWLQVISNFRKNSNAYKLYKSKILGLLNVINPCYLMGVEAWIFSPGTKYTIRSKTLKSDIEGILKLIRILNSSKNLIYIRAVRELESMLTDLSHITEHLVLTQAGEVHQV